MSSAILLISASPICVQANVGKNRKAIILKQINYELEIGPLHDPVTWYGINYAGTQITQWDFQNKEKSGWTGKSSFFKKVPLRFLCPSAA